ncbi:V/A-type H+-transporting ATPase subunit E [Pilibacter termitis]|uniref:V/A-type H+-transporting ATPase subunit E n=1 Tax=Pilibacter termitis TaxID=263852 RepID=A0A1T4K4R2_9ENTE|nr:hypothetical protein [Pilibacter termitis]SJZ37305.1 V/A-type H+-transporting ATPase subunit E [Pilibacter termitis]
MNDTLETMANAIATKQKEEIDKRIDEETQAAQEKLNREREQALLQLEKVQEKRKLELSQMKKQQIQRLQLEERQALLGEKQVALEEIFSLSGEELEKISEEEFQELVFHALENVKELGQAELVFGEKSIGKFSENKLTEWNQAHQGMFVFSKESYPKEAGFVIRKDGIEYNFLFASLLREVKEKELSVISQRLFQE